MDQDAIHSGAVSLVGVSTADALSNIPMLGYVGAYAFGNVLLAITGALFVRL